MHGFCSSVLTNAGNPWHSSAALSNAFEAGKAYGSDPSIGRSPNFDLLAARRAVDKVDERSLISEDTKHCADAVRNILNYLETPEKRAEAK